MTCPPADDASEDECLEGAEKTDDGVANEHATDDGDMGTEVTWREIVDQLRLNDSGSLEILRLFEDRYAVSSPIGAFTCIKDFLSMYMIHEFDHTKFRDAVSTLEDEETRKARLNSDLVCSATVMLRVAAGIAKAYSLRMSDWEDINTVCSRAVRFVPVYYHLKRALPGALNFARASRFLSSHALAHASDHGDGDVDVTNLWESEKEQRLFEETHGIRWSDIKNLTAHDDSVTACFTGLCEIISVSPVDGGGTLVCLQVVRLGDPPVGFPPKDLQLGDDVFWEVESSLGQLLETGCLLDAEWFETKNEICFMSTLANVAPKFAL